MPPQLPAPQKKGDAFANWVKRHPAAARWAGDIRRWAKAYGLDPIYVGAVLLLESGGNPNAVSSAGALGLMQIMPLHVGSAVPWAPGRRVTLADLKNPAFNLRWGTYYLAQQVNKYGYRYAYSKGYNPGYKGPGPWQYMPKGYVPGGTAAGSPTGAAERSVEEQTAKAALLSGVTFLELWHQRIDPIYEAYTGKRATRAQARFAISQGWSDYHLELLLSQSKKFVGSPVWQSRAGDYVAVWHQIYGDKTKAPTALIAYGIIHNLTGSAFADKLRQRKDYVGSNEFKTNATGLENVYRRIYGTPGPDAQNVIQRAVLSGWNEDQFAKYLRGQPEYSSSQEFGSKTLGALSALGMILGTAPTMVPGTATPYDSGGKAPAAPGPDQRVKGPGAIGGPDHYTPALPGGP